MKQNDNIPEQTVSTFARSIFKQAKEYGFSQIDYVRLVNNILDFATENSQREYENSSKKDEIEKTFFKGQLPVAGRNLVIRKFERKKDLQKVENWLKEESGKYFLLSTATSRILSIKELIKNKKHILGTILLKQNNLQIGLIAYLNVDNLQKKAELRKIIGIPEMRGKGYGKESTLMWIEYGKRELGLKKIYLNTLDTNIRNIKLNEELGFKIEGILRNEVLINGKYRDVLRMSLWND